MNCRTTSVLVKVICYVEIYILPEKVLGTDTKFEP